MLFNLASGRLTRKQHLKLNIAVLSKLTFLWYISIYVILIHTCMLISVCICACSKYQKLKRMQEIPLLPSWLKNDNRDWVESHSFIKLIAN